MPIPDLVRPSHADELRRCGRCGAAALVCSRAWQHRVAGLQTGSWTLDFACRSCGAEVTLHPDRQIRVERLFALLMLPAIFPSLFFFASARRKARAWSDNPVVTGVPAPPIQREEPRSACAACQGIARCMEIGRQQSGWLSLGTRFRYTCTRCAAEFTVHDVRAIAFAFVAAAVLSAAATLIILLPPGSDVGAAQSNRWFGVALLGIAVVAWVGFARRLVARRRHPLV